MRKAFDVADVSGGDPVAVAEVERLLRHSDNSLPVQVSTVSDPLSRAGSGSE